MSHVPRHHKAADGCGRPQHHKNRHQLLLPEPQVHCGRKEYGAEKYQLYGAGARSCPDSLGCLPEVDVYKRQGLGKTVIMTTQVTNEGSDMSVYEVGRSIKQEFGLLEAYDMTLEAVVTKIMWILGQTKDPARIRRMF